MVTGLLEGLIYPCGHMYRITSIIYCVLSPNCYTMRCGDNTTVKIYAAVTVTELPTVVRFGHNVTAEFRQPQN